MNSNNLYCTIVYTHRVHSTEIELDTIFSIQCFLVNCHDAMDVRHL